MHMKKSPLTFFTYFLWATCMMFASCQPRMIRIEDVEASQADTSSEKLSYVNLTKYPSLLIGRLHVNDAHFSVHLTQKGINSGPPALHTRRDASRIHTSVIMDRDTPYIVDRVGGVSRYNHGDKEWCIMVLWKNDDVVIIWNRLNAGDSVNFKHDTAPYVYKVVRFIPTIEDPN